MEDQRKELPPLEWVSPFEDGTFSRREIGSGVARSYFSRALRVLLLLSALSLVVNGLLWKVAGEARKRIEVARSLVAPAVGRELAEFDPFLFRALDVADGLNWSFGDRDEEASTAGKPLPAASPGAADKTSPAQALRAMGFYGYMGFVRLNGRYTDEVALFKSIGEGKTDLLHHTYGHLERFYIKSLEDLVERREFGRAYRVAALGAQLSRELDTAPTLSQWDRSLQVAMNKLLLLEAVLEQHPDFFIFPAIGDHYASASLSISNEGAGLMPGSGLSRPVEAQGFNNLRTFFEALAIFRSGYFAEARVRFADVCGDQSRSKLRELACFNAARAVFWNVHKAREKLTAAERDATVRALEALLGKIETPSLRNDIEYYIKDVRTFRPPPRQARSR
jgi:hypothetical protein